MKETQIKLTNIQDIREFVNQVILLEYEVDLIQGRYVIDAKSIMGISKPCSIFIFHFRFFFPSQRNEFLVSPP